jgi:transcriptional regulator with XRE-family HTH domain
MLDMAQRTLAERAVVHRNAISYWERGHRVPTVLELARVARVLGSPLWELFDVVDENGATVSNPWRGRR